MIAATYLDSLKPRSAAAVYLCAQLQPSSSHNHVVKAVDMYLLRHRCEYTTGIIAPPRVITGILEYTTLKSIHHFLRCKISI